MRWRNLSIQATYKSNHILLCDSTTSSGLNFCFFIYFIVIQKKKISAQKKLSKKKEIFICEIFHMSHFVIHIKLQHIFLYLYWNFDTPTPCLALYSTADLTIQTLIFQFFLSKPPLVFESRLQKQPIIIKFQLSSKMSHLLSGTE